MVILRKILDFSVARTADILDMPPGSVKSDLHRGLTALRTLLGTREEANE